MQKTNEKLLSFVIILLWEVIYVHFYNWDNPLDFAPVVYNLIELIIETSLWSMDYSTFDTHTQHTRLCLDNVYLICVIVHVQMWCVCSISCRSNPKRFFSVLWVFKSDYDTFVSLVFVKNAILCFSSKTGSEVFSRVARDLKLPAKFAWGKLKNHIFIQKLLLLPREYFATKLFSRNVLGKTEIFWSSYKGYRDCVATISWLRASRESLSMSRDLYRDCLTRKKRVFSVFM